MYAFWALLVQDGRLGNSSVSGRSGTEQKVGWLVGVWDSMGLRSRSPETSHQGAALAIEMEDLGPGTPALPFTSCFFHSLFSPFKSEFVHRKEVG